ncbi:hypothetical protein [Pelagibaculum spongiae]|uniref:Uncharacterized protein n=1 Tax=Pelagibaculum spongiae TaxID=2080658 RepID=A0A2V1GQU9_9GAMM|nr:hypothetical protein [Pelagibaculum spongiae]PVZ66361.1 hypothetical protein DC094_16825 [Pelagibaculum spongiae]
MSWRLLGNGCDKRFYIKENSEVVGSFGAICCSDSVASREMKAYIRLKCAGLSSLLPAVLPWTQGNILPEGITIKPQYMIERLHIGRTFKPQMCVFNVSRQVNAELNKGDKIKILKSLKLIEDNLFQVCNIVGELTLAICAQKKDMFLLDFSPGETGSTAISQIDTIKSGINNLKKRMEDC